MALSGLDGRVVIVTGGAAGIGRAVGESASSRRARASRWSI